MWVWHEELALLSPAEQVQLVGKAGSLLGAELDQWCSAHEKAKDIGHDIIDDDHHDGHNEPDETLKHVLDDEVGLGDDTEKSHVCPSKERKLAQVIFLDQGEDKPDKT